MKYLIFLILFNLLFITNCNKSSDPLISKGRVQLVDYEIEFGKPNEKHIKEGLTITVNTIDNMLSKSKDSSKNIHGSFECSYRLEVDGKVRMFLDGANHLQNDENFNLMDQFAGKAFSTKWPNLGSVTMVKAKYKIEKDN